MEEYYTLQQVADMLQMHIDTIRDFVRNGDLPAYRVGKREYRVSKSDFDEFMKKRRTKDANPQ